MFYNTVQHPLIMSKYDPTQFAKSINRLILFFISLIQWIIGLKKISSQESLKTSSRKDEYIECQKNKFLETFLKEDNYNWNSNVDEIMKDQKELSEILKTPNTEIEKKWQSRILIENTPRGNVIMFYDVYKRAFSYYCDQAVMPYDIMNAVAMKYVLTFHCRDLFVDSNVLPVPSPTSVEDTPSKPTLSNIEKLDNKAFAKFKTYNNSTKKAGILPENDKTINCFLHLGASRNWLPISKKVKSNPLNGFQTDLMPQSNKKLSYLDYKKQSSC